MIVKAKSLSTQPDVNSIDCNPVFTVPQSVKISNFTPKRHINDYLQNRAEIQLKNSITKPNETLSLNQKISCFSYFENPAKRSQTSNKVKQYNEYLKDYVKTKNSSFSPLLKVSNPIKQEFYSTAFESRPRKKSNTPQREKHRHSHKGRPARFLSQEDLENHIRSVKNRVPRPVDTKGDLKILMENNQDSQLKNLEIDKICDHYKRKYKKKGIIKKRDWNWESPENTQRNVKFKDLS